MHLGVRVRREHKMCKGTGSPPVHSAAARPPRSPSPRIRHQSVVKPLPRASEVDIGELEHTYAVIRVIGRGGMGSVVLARHRVMQHDVAIKIASTEKFDAEALARFSREATLMARLQHPNIVRLYEIGRISAGRVGIVMEYVRGQSLAQMLATGRALAFDRCLQIVHDLSNALAHAHAQGIIHRDVKPQNVLLEAETGRAKLADFGIAKVASDVADVTATGAALGTPAYMSPEHIDAAVLDGRSDIYSLGVVAWEAITGQRPWAGESLYNLLYRQKNEALPRVDHIRPDTPPRLVFALEGALAKNRDNRWSSVNDMVAQLESDEPTAALLERRAREAASRRAGPLAESIDATTIPLPRRRQLADTARVSTSSAESDETLSLPPKAPANALAPAVAPAGVPEAGTSTRPRWRQAVPFGAGLVIGGVVAVLALRQFAPDVRSALGRAETSAPAPSGVVAPGGTGPSRPDVPASPTEGKPSAPVPPPTVAGAPVVTEGASPASPRRDVPPGSIPSAPTDGRATGGPGVNGTAGDTVPVGRVGTEAPAAPFAPAPSRDGALPPSPTASPAFALGTTTIERQAAALAEATRARDLVYAARWWEGLRLVESALKSDPGSGAAYAIRARLRVRIGDRSAAWSDVELARRNGARWEALLLSTILIARDRSTEEARELLQPYVAESLSPGRTLEADRAVSLAAALVQLGDSFTALRLLEKASTTDARLAPLLNDPLLAPLRTNARFQRVLRRATK